MSDCKSRQWAVVVLLFLAILSPDCRRQFTISVMSAVMQVYLVCGWSVHVKRNGTVHTMDVTVEMIDHYGITSL